MIGLHGLSASEAKEDSRVSGSSWLERGVRCQIRVRATMPSSAAAAGYMAAEFCNIQNGDTIAVWGCGPVGQFAIRSAFLLGAGSVIAIDTVPERLAMAKSAGARRWIS